jgi:hypothetical protein
MSEVSEQVILETVAKIDAASSVESTMNGDSVLSEKLVDAAWRLFQEVFPTKYDTDEEHDTDPRYVEVYARSAELAAEWLDEISPRASQYRENARRIRAAGLGAPPSSSTAASAARCSG